MKQTFACLSLLLSSILTSEETIKGFEVVENKASLSLLNPTLKERKTIKLRLDNGLEAYLISDPQAEQSAAGLTVEAGSWQDPKEYPGMAHFLEHMLFMGTKAYPKEFEYMQYITDNGGMVNAATWPDHTVYMFSINNNAFEEALDRFSHFFIDPLFSVSCIGRELHAVDQEHAKNIENDGWREYMIFKETGNPAHPNAAFSTGNAKTLSGIPQQALKKWYQEHYSAHQMHLVMISPLPLDEMIDLAVHDFSRVQMTETPPVSLTAPMLSANQRGHFIYIKPIKDLKSLSLVWEVPRKFAQDRSRAAIPLVAYALQNRSENSLLEELKREKIAEGLQVIGDRFGKDYLLFRIDISLTEYGVSQINTAIERTFQAINRLKETMVPEYIFDEMQNMATLNYQYQSRENAFEFITHAANAMMYEDLSTFPENTAIPSHYDPSFVAEFIDSLVPQQCIYFVEAPPALTHISPKSKEKWMRAEYTVQSISDQRLAFWESAPLHEQIDLPSPNPFIPSHLALEASLPGVATPQLIAEEEGAKVYFAKDNQYFIPEIAALFSLKSPLIDGSARSSACSDLYLKALVDFLSPTLFFAQEAGLSPRFSADGLKLSLSVQGYSEKAPTLIKTLFHALKQVNPSQDQFNIYKQSLLSVYDNANKELPVRQASELLSSMIFNDTPTNSEKMAALSQISYEEFLSFSETLFEVSYTEALLYGNLNQEEAIAIWDDAKSALDSQPYLAGEHAVRHVLVLPEKQQPNMVIQRTERQGNGIILLIEEGPFSFENRGAQQVLSKALQEAFFDTLRTKQQTAYIAKAWDSEIERQLLQFFAVQSNSHHPSELIARFELFLEDFVKNLADKVSPERFENLRNMLITSLQMPPENLQAMSQRLYLLAFDYEADFDWYTKRIESLQALTYDHLVKAAHQFLSRSNQRRLAVLVEGVLSPETDFHYEQVSKEQVLGVGTYVTWR